MIVKIASIEGLEQLGRNLYKVDGKYFRLFGKGVTPNTCWICAPFFQELVDIDTATGNDVYGDLILELEDTVGTIPIYRDFIRY